ncbi:MAG: hypothetical protein K2Y03_07640 [Sphingomonas sp.]|nr:hypothetical protein [Sphingomonas sp.]
MLLATSMVAGCQQAPSAAFRDKALPPRLTDADLLAALVASGDWPDESPIHRAARLQSLGACIDLHRPEPSLADMRWSLNSPRAAATRAGRVRGITGWMTPASTGGLGPVPPETEHRLADASAKALQKASPDNATDSPGKPWPKQCDAFDWFNEPAYAENYAFVDRGSSCGGECGSGRIFALEYRDRRWRLVGIVHTWIA